MRNQLTMIKVITKWKTSTKLSEQFQKSNLQFIETAKYLLWYKLYTFATRYLFTFGYIICQSSWNTKSFSKNILHLWFFCLNLWIFILVYFSSELWIYISLIVFGKSSWWTTCMIWWPLLNTCINESCCGYI